jgi:hypothetical protein
MSDFPRRFLAQFLKQLGWQVRETVAVAVLCSKFQGSEKARCRRAGDVKAPVAGRSEPFRPRPTLLCFLALADIGAVRPILGSVVRILRASTIDLDYAQVRFLDLPARCYLIRFLGVFRNLFIILQLRCLTHPSADCEP